MSEKENDIDIDVSVNLTIKGKTVHLTLDELTALQGKIKEILNYVKETQFVPTYPIYRDPLVPEDDRGPWAKNTIITWGISSKSGGENI